MMPLRHVFVCSCCRVNALQICPHRYCSQLEVLHILVMIRKGVSAAISTGPVCAARCGRVMNVTIARDLQGKPRGFAHVEFSNELEAQNALSLSGAAHFSSCPIMFPLLPLHICKILHVWF